MTVARSCYNVKVRKRTWDDTRENPHERAFRALADESGWVATKRGWPDFICYRRDSDEVIAVEVKPRNRHGHLQGLKDSQVRCLSFLQSKGIRCFVSDGKKLEQFNARKHCNARAKRLRAEQRRLQAERKPW